MVNINPLKYFRKEREASPDLAGSILSPKEIVGWILSRAATGKLPFDRHAIFRVAMNIPDEWEEAFWIASVSNSLWCFAAWVNTKLGADAANTAMAAIIERMQEDQNELNHAVLTIYKAMLTASNSGIFDDFPLSEHFIQRIGPLNIEKAYKSLDAVRATPGLFCRSAIEMLASYLQAHTRCSLGAFDVIANHIASTFQCKLLSDAPLGDVSLFKPEVT